MYREESRGGRFDGPREMHKATCAECGKETEVPFKPDGSRPVYCRDCYQKRKPKRF
ncbi:MAG: DNA-directed RNA polymerase [Euryarchaeota archaeon]|nr:DNA-directed RNA polymerase [Euryarchaeota archaeon]